MSTAYGLQKISRKLNGQLGQIEKIVQLMRRLTTMIHFAHLSGKQTKLSSNTDGPNRSLSLLHFRPRLPRGVLFSPPSTLLRYKRV